MTTTNLPTITDEQVVFYHEQGYLVVEDLLDEATMSALRRETDTIVADAADLTESDAIYDLEDSHTPQQPRVRRLKAPSAHFPFFRELAQHPALMAVVTRLIGPDVRLQNDKLNMKSAEYGAPVEWHADWPFYPHTNDDLLAAGVLLDDCDLENGPLLVVPGSHKKPSPDHHDPKGYFCGAVHPDDLDFEPSQAVPLTARAGTVTFHHCRTMHGSDLNRSDRERRLLLFGYAAADAWPLMGLGTMTLDYYAGLMCAGQSTLQPRLTEVPVKLPLPPAPNQGSIYENQKSIGRRFFNSYDKSD